MNILEFSKVIQRDLIIRYGIMHMAKQAQWFHCFKNNRGESYEKNNKSENAED